MDDCGIFFRKGIIYVVSTSVTHKASVGVSVGPMFKVESKSPLEVGSSVISALNATRYDLPESAIKDPVIGKKMRDFLGVKSWAELERTSVYASAEREGSETKIYSHRIGRGGGFEPDGTVITCSSGDVEEIGRGVLRALKVLESEE